MAARFLSQMALPISQLASLTMLPCFCCRRQQKLGAYDFTRVFPAASSQEDLYDGTTRGLVRKQPHTTC